MTPDKDSRRKKIDQALKYSGIAFELLVFMLIAVFVGQKLDQRFGIEDQYITIGLVLLALFGFLYRLILQLNQDS